MGKNFFRLILKLALLLPSLGLISLLTNLSSLFLKKTLAFAPLKTAVIIYYYPDSPSYPYTNDQVREIFYTHPKSVNSFFAVSTYGKITFQPITYGPYKIVIERNIEQICPSIQSDYSKIGLIKAINQGLNFEEVDILVFFYPQPPNCRSGAMGYSFQGKKAVWIPTSDLEITDHKIFTLIHELGHTLSLGHASLLLCNPLANLFSSNLYNACPIDQYGDPSDSMGNSFHEFSGLHRMYLGVLENDEIETVTQSGIYRVYHLHSAGKPKLLSIPLPNSNHKDSYFIDFRIPQGVFDSDLDPLLAEGVQIRVGSSVPVNNYENLHLSSLLVNLPSQISTPHTPPYAPTYNLKDNELFKDTFNQVTIKQLEHNSDFATVEIQYPVKFCLESLIEFEITPPLAIGKVNQEKKYLLTAINRNDSSCPPFDFNIKIETENYKPDWIITPSNFQITLLPNQSSTTEITITPQNLQNTRNGDYKIFIKIYSSSGQLIDRKSVILRIQDFIEEAKFKDPFFLVNYPESYTNYLKLTDINGNEYHLSQDNQIQWQAFDADIINQTLDSITVKPQRANIFTLYANINISDSEFLSLKSEGYALKKPGDLTNDGIVNNQDIPLLIKQYNLRTSSLADIFEDWLINSLDYGKLLLSITQK